jgi:hypothetical protein
MGGWGRQNPWPLQWGGGKSSFEQLWDAMRSMLGTKGAGPVGSLEDAWRESKVAGMLAVLTMAERAALQATPEKATDHLPVYESLLKLPRAATQLERQQAVGAAWTESLSAVLVRLQVRLTAIDADVTILPLDPDATHMFHFGAAFQTDAATFPFRPVGSSSPLESSWPMFSQHWIMYIYWLNQPGGIPPAATRLLVERELNKSLPAWTDWRIITKIGFLLDLDPLDLTAFGV